jgi:hypothetical protein
MNTQALFTLSDAVFAKAELEVLRAMTLRIAGQTVILQFANEHLNDVIGPTFRHLEAETTGRADLSIRVWDRSCSPFGEPVLPPPEGDTGLTHYSGAIQCIVDHATGRIEAYDSARRCGMLYLPDLSKLDPGYAAAPMCTLLHWWAIDHGWLLLHAGCVANEDGAALLVGRGGSGKSTTVLGCINSEFGLLADDYCLYQPGNPGLVHSLFNSSKIDSQAIALMPFLGSAFAGAQVDPRGKRIIQVYDHFPGSWRIDAPLRAIIVPQIGPGPGCTAERIDPADALRALAPSTLLQLAGGRNRAFEQMARLVRMLPCWRLVIGPDPRAAREQIAIIISSAERCK